MPVSRKLTVLLALCLMCLTGVLVALFSGRASSQSPVPPGSQIGRYQIIPAGSGSNPYIYFLDTKTGQCWMAGSPSDTGSSKGWDAIPSPVFPKGK